MPPEEAARPEPVLLAVGAVPASAAGIRCRRLPPPMRRWMMAQGPDGAAACSRTVVAPPPPPADPFAPPPPPADPFAPPAPRISLRLPDPAQGR